MSFFNEDPFDDLIREFFNHGGSNRRSSKKYYSDYNEASENLVESSKSYYFVMELPSFKNVEIGEKISGDSGKVKILKIILDDDEEISYILPKKVKTKDYTHTFKNGILEVEFQK